MKLITNYLANADECDRLARKARTPQEKQQILEMAATWRALAAERKERARRVPQPQDT